MASFDELEKAWEQDKVIRFADIDEKVSLKRQSMNAGGKYAVWGAGMLGEFFIETVQLSGGTVTVVVDKEPGKIGMGFHGVTIERPEVLAGQGELFDYLLIAHHTRFEEIEREALEMGVPEEKIVLPYEV